jgi:hypothetical protein
MGQMAPSPPMSRSRAIELVEAGHLPLLLGAPHQCVTILEQDGRFRIRQLVIDEAEATAAGRAAIAAGRGWMPEQYYGLGKPTGTIHADAPTREALVEIMRAMEWPPHW